MSSFFFVIFFPFSLVIANRLAYLWARNTGRLCRESVDVVSVIKEERRDGFRTDFLCWPTGLQLEKGRKYRLTLETPGDWFDKSYRTDVLGFPSSRNWIFLVCMPFRRWWSASWFTPVARVGAKGSDEFALVRSARRAKLIHSDTYPETDSLAHRIVGESEPINAPISDGLAEALEKLAPTPPDRRSVSTIVEPAQTGELFLFVNDVVLMIPGKIEFFLSNNRGSGWIIVEPVE